MPAKARPALPVLALAASICWLLLERRRPLRRWVDPSRARIVRNVSIGAITAVTVRALEKPLTERMTGRVGAARLGFTQRLPLPSGCRDAAAVVMLDYTLYWWHVLLHRIPALWQLHLPHHIDVDLDSTTALRFHFLEFVASIPWRALQIVAIGVSPRALKAWQLLTAFEVLFHHSNIRLPERWERRLMRFLVTPRLHGLHHSRDHEQRNSNFSSGLTVWDRWHRTYRTDGLEQPPVGVPGYERAADTTLGKTLVLPFHPRRAREELKH